MPPSIADICNYRHSGPRLATSGQPREEELAAIAAAGYEVIINLALHDDPRYSLPDEAASVRALGLTYVHIPVRFDAPTDGDLDAFFAAMERFGDAQLWLHCALNKRVSAFLGLYRHLRQGWPQAEAFALLREIWEPDAVWSAFIARQLSWRDVSGP
jgi:protein tyrosine phosphatase (PTP) superfamily phosphohydrolase (DUF442 family)